MGSRLIWSLCGPVFGHPHMQGLHQRSLYLLSVPERQHWYCFQSHSNEGKIFLQTQFVITIISTWIFLLNNGAKHSKSYSKTHTLLQKLMLLECFKIFSFSAVQKWWTYICKLWVLILIGCYKLLWQPMRRKVFSFRSGGIYCNCVKKIKNIC